MDNQLYVGTTKELKANKMEAIRNPRIRLEAKGKPLGGLWTSTINEQGGSGWTEYLENERWNPYGNAEVHRFVLTPRADVKLIEIYSYEAYRVLQKYFPGNDGTIDWVKMSEQFDGVHMTAQDMPSELSFGCESTCWFRWVFEEVKEQ